MSKQKRRILLTSALPYANGAIHIGHMLEYIEKQIPDTDTEIVCYCKVSLRGYEAAGILSGAGWRNVRVMEGGLMAWPY